MCVLCDACFPPYAGEGGALIVMLLYTARLRASVGGAVMSHILIS